MGENPWIHYHDTLTKTLSTVVGAFAARNSSDEPVNRQSSPDDGKLLSSVG